MNKFRIYSHNKFDPEAEMIYICSCNSREMAVYVKNAMELMDKGGNKHSESMNDYYIETEKK